MTKEIRTFELWNTVKREKFTIEAELSSRQKNEWKALCPYHSDKIKSLGINADKRTFNCLGCAGQTKGIFFEDYQKPKEKPKDKKKEEQKPVIDKKRMIKLAGLYYETLEQGIRIILREERGLSDKVIDKYRIGYTLKHWNLKDLPYRKHKDCFTIPVYKGKELVNIRYHTRKKKADPKDLPYQTGLEYPTWLYPEEQLKERTLILTEGELDALCSMSQGLPAITVTGGAGTWKPEFTKRFKSKVLYIILDCDKAGRDGAKKIARELEPVVREIRIVDLDPERQDGYDLTNWFITDGKSKEELLKLIQKTPVYIRQDLPGAETLKEKEKKKEPSRKEFKPSLYAKNILARYKIIYDKHKRLWFYDQNEGIWKDNFETLCRSILRKGLLASFDSNYYENETIEAIKDLSYQENIPSEPAEHLIPFKNGIYDIRKDNLRPFDSKYFFINKLGVNYNPENKDCPDIDNLFKQVVSKKNIVTLKEIIAYVMYRGYPYPKAFMLYGNGANGKSTYCQVVRKVIGNENVSSISLNTLIYNTFGTSRLYGKLINISPEMSYNVLKKTDTLKQLTGKDLVTAEKKFKDEFQFVNYAKLIFIGNEIPYSEDKSFAFFRRMFLIEFPKRFEIKIKADPFIIEKIPEEEFEALAYQSINTLKELEKNLFTFTRHKRTEEIMREYESLSDPLGIFLEEFTEGEPESDIPVKNFNFEFKKYQKENGLRQWTDLQISKIMSQKGYIKKTLRVSTNIEGEYRFYKAYLELKWK
jgi:P4 family phage/plasmid primase-like protien